MAVKVPGGPLASAAVHDRFWRVMALVLLAAVGLRVAYVLTVTRYDQHVYDAFYYENQARSIAQGDGFFKNPLVAFTNPSAKPGPAADHPPLTALVLVPAAFIDNLNHRKLAMRFTMVLVGLVGIVIIGLLARELGGDTVGLVAAGIAAVDPNLWMNDGLIMSESLAVLLTAAVLLCAYRVLRGASMRWVVALGVLCGLVALVRAELAVFVLLIALPAIWVGTRRTGRDFAIKGAVVVVAAVVVIGPWVGYNLARFEKPTFISTNDGLTLVAANCPKSYYGVRLGSGDLSCAVTTKGDESVTNAENRHLALSYMRHHLGRLPVVIATRAARMWSVFRVSQTVGFDVGEGRPRWASWAGVITLYLLVILAVGGGIVLRRRRVPIWPLVVPIAVVTGMVLLIAGVPRYRAVAEPSIVALAAVGIGWLGARAGRRREAEPSPTGT
jgi:4-amino-4-deoxy-L-arabinose transferase-like glycosyltransferase